MKKFDQLFSETFGWIKAERPERYFEIALQYSKTAVKKDQDLPAHRWLFDMPGGIEQAQRYAFGYQLMALGEPIDRDIDAQGENAEYTMMARQTYLGLDKIIVKYDHAWPVPRQYALMVSTVAGEFLAQWTPALEPIYKDMGGAPTWDLVGPKMAPQQEGDTRYFLSPWCNRLTGEWFRNDRGLFVLRGSAPDGITGPSGLWWELKEKK